MKQIKLVLVIFTSVLAANGYSQLSTSFYSNASSSKLALGYQFNNKLWGDLRIYSDTNVNNITPEIVVNHNFVQNDLYYSYVGGGIILNNINGIIAPLGIGITPFESAKNFSFNIELNPLYEIDLNNIFIRGFVGIRYKLD